MTATLEVPPLRPDRLATLSIAAASAGALGTALVAQYGFDLWPCALCFVQRAPYAATLALGLLASLPAVDAPSRRAAIDLAAVLFAVGALAAGYHVGVEERWWPGPTECTGLVADFTAADLLSAVAQPGRTGCEEAAVRILGVSMAGYNAIAAAILSGLCVAARRQRGWWT
jgi:disulfide bond formation protein DsbB